MALQLKSHDLVKRELVNKQIEKQFKFFQRIENLGTNSILFDSTDSTHWIVATDGTKLRSICGHRTTAGVICFRPAGSGTEHSGFGFCKPHSKGPLYNLALSESQNYPTRLIGLLEHSDEIENQILDKFDPEIKIMTALLNYVITLPAESEREELTLDEIDMAKDLLKEIVKTKSIRAKLMKEIQLDYKNVKEFVNQIFTIIINDVQGPLAKKVLSDIYNLVLVPYQNSSKLSSGDGKLVERIREVAKTSPNEF